MSLEEEIGKVQTSLWMAEKLARLCREILRARDTGQSGDVVRLADEIEQLVQIPAFAEAVAAVSQELFYPAALREMMRLLETGAALTLEEAKQLAADEIFP